MVKYGVRSPKFVWALYAQRAHRLRPRNPRYSRIRNVCIKYATVPLVTCTSTVLFMESRIVLPWTYSFIYYVLFLFLET